MNLLTTLAGHPMPGRVDSALGFRSECPFSSGPLPAAGNRPLLNIYQPLRLRFQLALELPRYFDHARVHESVAAHPGILEAMKPVTAAPPDD